MCFVLNQKNVQFFWFSTVYELRHSFPTLCSEKGVPNIVLKQLMEYSDLLIIKQYYIHISLDRKKQEIKRL